MPSALRETTTQKVAEFQVPYNGTWDSGAANALPPNTLYNSLNVFIRRGKLRRRPGLRLFRPTVFDSDILGGELAIPSTGKLLLAASQHHLYKLTEHDDDWTIPDNCTDVFDLTAQDTIDMAFMETSDMYVGIIADGHTMLKQWTDDDGVSTIEPLAGTVPIAKSVCIAARRVVALVYPHTLRWTATLDHRTWFNSNIGKVGSTTDEGICVLPLGTLDFVLYKEHSIHLAKAQAGSDANAFSIKFSQETDGPAGIHAVAQAHGYHIYMTDNGRIGLFDGQSYVRWIADGLWTFLQDDIYPAFAHKIFGVYDHRLHIVTFYYPRHGDYGLLHGMVTIQLPLEGSGIESYPAFLGRSAIPCTHGYPQRFADSVQRSVVFSTSVNDIQSFYIDETADMDDTTPFSCVMQTGLQPMPDLHEFMVNMEIFLERQPNNGSALLSPVISHVLESEAGTVGLPQTIDLNTNPIGEYLGFNKPTRFFGFRLEWTSTSTVRYAGAIAYGRPIA